LTDIALLFTEDMVRIKTCWNVCLSGL